MRRTIIYQKNTTHMAQLFIGSDYIEFNYANANYKGVVSKITLEEKTIYRVDYTCKENKQTGRFEVFCHKDECSDGLLWKPLSNMSDDLLPILRTAIEKHPELQKA